MSFNMSDLTAKLQQLQNQVDQFNQMQMQVQAPTQAPQQGAPSYPRVIRSDTVEDILSNPQWRNELTSEFDNSDMGRNAKNYREVLFLEFCEKQTGKDSMTLSGLRRDAENQKRPTREGTEKSGSNSNKNTKGAGSAKTGDDA